MIRALLIAFFSGILVAMLLITSYAALQRSIWNVGPELTSDPWFQATLADAYFGFVTFYVWVAYKEQKRWPRVVWFLLIMTLGNMAMATYVLLQLWKWDPTTGIEAILLRNDAGANKALRP